jgi:FkbM family methyltransferase
MQKKTRDFVKELLIRFRIDLTRNIKYDRLTRIIISTSIRENDNCIDVGCHKGEILDLMLKSAPLGKHYVFEPIPFLYDQLKTQYEGRAHVFPFALSDKNGESTFQLVKNALAYSGIKKRAYKLKDPDIEEITVALKTLDEIIPSNEKIRFVKIDVEGGELGVLKGAKRVLSENKPIIIFEFGKGASEFYGSSPDDIFKLLCTEHGYHIYTLKYYIQKKKPVDFEMFQQYFNSGDEYYFIASIEVF